MKSFRTEYELVEAKKIIVEKDVIELGEKIEAFKKGEISDDKFRALRLARGVYGQRQQGVQMIRIKLPYGRVSANQLRRIASVSDEYSTGRLHITTRQDIQIHYVSLDRTPQLWADLEKDDVTLREACGNTVRNVTASDTAGINPKELFDVSPYADLVFRYFLRKPFGQELGRKIKIAFSSTDADDAFTYIHDFGFIPRIQNGLRGFKVVIGGGLGAQPFLAQQAYDFLPTTEILPFIEASIRVFDRYGERTNRNKARLKYLLGKLGLSEFLNLVEAEKKAIQFEISDFDVLEVDTELSTFENTLLSELIKRTEVPEFKNWLTTNVFSQKQSGYYAVYAKLSLGDFYTNQARELADFMDELGLPELRFTIDQNIQFRFLKLEQLELIFNKLQRIGLSSSGYYSVGDITACPGTDTCNLGISNSTATALAIEELIELEYPKLLKEKGLKIKISGCMNSCGQHGLSQIGLHGSSIKVKDDGSGKPYGVLPALQILLGGGSLGFGDGKISEKVIKVPSKRILSAIRLILNDFLLNQEEEEAFIDYYARRENQYFYQLLKPLGDLTELVQSDFMDWGNDEKFETAIGVGECAGVMIDLVASLYFDAKEKFENAQTSYAEKRFADACYFAYSAAIHAAKARLIQANVRCNTQHGILSDYDEKIEGNTSFSERILKINKNKPTEEFTRNYLADITLVLTEIKENNEK